MSNVKFVNILLFKMEKVNCIVGVMRAHAELFFSLPPPALRVKGPNYSLSSFELQGLVQKLFVINFSF